MSTFRLELATNYGKRLRQMSDPRFLPDALEIKTKRRSFRTETLEDSI